MKTVIVIIQPECKRTSGGGVVGTPETAVHDAIVIDIEFNLYDMHDSSGRWSAGQVRFARQSNPSKFCRQEISIFGEDARLVRGDGAVCCDFVGLVPILFKIPIAVVVTVEQGKTRPASNAR